MNLKYKKNDDAVTVLLNGELDECSATNVKTILDKLISENLCVSTFVFDLSGVSFMDSTGIGLLIGRYKRLKQFGIKSFIKGASVSTEKVIELAGLYSIMPKF